MGISRFHLQSLCFGLFWIVFITGPPSVHLEDAPECDDSEAYDILPFWFTYLLEQSESPGEVLGQRYDPTVDCRNMSNVIADMEVLQEKCSDHLHNYYKVWDLKDLYEETCIEYGCYYAGDHCIQTHIHEVCAGVEPECLKIPYMICDKTLNLYKDDLADAIEYIKTKCDQAEGGGVVEDVEDIATLPSTDRTRNGQTTSTERSPTRTSTTTRFSSSRTSSSSSSIGSTRKESTATRSSTSSTRLGSSTEATTSKGSIHVATPAESGKFTFRFHLDLDWKKEYLDMKSIYAVNLRRMLEGFLATVYQKTTRLVEEVKVAGFSEGSVNADVDLLTTMPLSNEHQATLGIILNETLIARDHKLPFGHEDITVLDAAVVVTKDNNTRLVSLDQGKECFALNLNTSCNNGMCELTFFGMPRCKCNKGYTGTDCTEETTTSSDSIAAIISVSVFAGVIVLLCLVLTLLWACSDSGFLRRNKKRLSEKLQNSSPSAVPIVGSSPDQKSKPNKERTDNPEETQYLNV